MGTFRAFVALELPDDVRRHAAAILEDVRGRVAPGAFAFVRPESLHVTLHFIGALSDEKADAVAAAMRDAVATHPVGALRTTVLGSFPPRRPPRVLWLGLDGEGVPALAGIHRAIAGAMVAMGFPKPDHDLTPHITIARARKTASSGALRSAHDVLKQVAVEPLQFYARRISLMESTGSAQGSVYTPRASVELA